MSEASVPAGVRPAPPPYPPPELVDALERELVRLRERRPHLAKKVARAAHILVTHLSTPGGVICVRVGKGKPRFLVRSLNASGAVYVVYSGDWSCSCPNFHRSYERGATCKHVISCYVLWKLGRQSRSYGAVIERGPDGCPMCQDGIVRVGQEYVHATTGEVVERTTALPCRRCKGGAR